MKSLGCKMPQNIKSFYIFITSSAGVGKSNLEKKKKIHILLIKE